MVAEAGNVGLTCGVDGHSLHERSTSTAKSPTCACVAPPYLVGKATIIIAIGDWKCTRAIVSTRGRIIVEGIDIDTPLFSIPLHFDVVDINVLPSPSSITFHHHLQGVDSV